MIFFGSADGEKLMRCNRRHPDGPQYLVSISYSVLGFLLSARALVKALADRILIYIRLALAKSCGSKGCEKWTNRGRINFLRFTFDRCLRAHRTRARRWRRADGRRGAPNLWAAGARARRAVAAFILPVLARINNNRLLFGHGGFEDILGKVRNRRAFTLQHIVVHIGGCGARRNARLQHVLG